MILIKWSDKTILNLVSVDYISILSVDEVSEPFPDQVTHVVSLGVVPNHMGFLFWGSEKECEKVLHSLWATIHGAAGPRVMIDFDRFLEFIGINWKTRYDTIHRSGS